MYAQLLNDDDGHWYIVYIDYIPSFRKWLELDADMRSEEPLGGKRIDGPHSIIIKDWFESISLFDVYDKIRQGTSNYDILEKRDNCLYYQESFEETEDEESGQIAWDLYIDRRDEFISLFPNQIEIVDFDSDNDTIWFNIILKETLI